MIEIATDKDIVAISVPFTAGVVAAAYLPHGGMSYSLLALLSSASIIPFLLLSLRKESGRYSISLLYLFLGAFCYCGAAAFIGDAGSGTVATGSGMSWLSARIESLGLRHESSAELLQALLTGRKDSLSRECIGAFRAAGASHILALSGLHLGIIYGLAGKLLTVTGNSRAGQVARSALLVILCGAYTLATGAGPSITRAFLFVLLKEIRKVSCGRSLSSARALNCSLLIQLAVNPLVIKSLGFQLSYLAMCGITFVAPRLREWYPESSKLDIMRRIWESVAMSVSCQLFTAPLVFLRFGTFPRYFLVSNLFCLPLTELLTSMAAACLLLDAIGLCPGKMKVLCDMLAQNLMNVIEVIASL
ncbi:MAG: ComEC/Rec2 family competence protein [Bacteroidales bacterium]|nr:ComEC/Rec2 family competence protein [Candidatus Cryptobacteroides equifaecalis]